MNNIFLQLLAAGLILCSAAAQDTIILKNGDVLSGTILKQNVDDIYFRSSAFGTVSLRTADVAEIRIAAAEAEKASKAEPASPPAEPPAPAVVENNPEQKNDRWSGQAGLAIAMRESNTLRRRNDNIVEQDESFESYRVYGNIGWSGEQQKLRWDWTYRYSRTDVRKNDDYFNLTQKYDHSFPEKKYYATAKTLYQRDFRRGIEDEYLQTAQLGIRWFDKDPFHFTTSVGGGYHHYARTVTVNNQEEHYTNALPKFVLDQSLRWQIISSLTLFQKYTHLGDLENYHFIFSSGVENKLVKDLFLRLEYRLDRDTEVAYDDRGYYDKALLTSVLYKF